MPNFKGEMNMYKPIVPKWVADILTKQREGNPLATIGHTKEWDKWKRKYARLNGWIVEED